jgi:hypothetical protein
MRPVLIVVTSLLLLGGGGVFLWQQRHPETPPGAGSRWPTDEADEVLGVEAFMRNVDDHRGTVRVEGVVSAVAAADRTLTLIDVAELKRCGVVTCAPLSLPVRWNGPMPSVPDVVRLTGEVQDQHGKLIFLASTLEKLDLETEASP